MKNWKFVFIYLFLININICNSMFLDIFFKTISKNAGTLVSKGIISCVGFNSIDYFFLRKNPYFKAKLQNKRLKMNICLFFTGGAIFSLI